MQLRSRVALFTVALLGAGLPALVSAQTGNKAVVISTASVEGETISCGCQKKDIGGIARRATVIQDARSQTPAYLLVDAGDFGSAADFKPWMRTEFQWEMMGKLGYDVVTPGPNEMVDGLDALRTLYASQPAIQVTSANVTDKSGNLLWPDHVIIERGGVRFGVVGVTDKSFYSYNLTRGKQKSDDFEFQDIHEALARLLPTLRPQVDVVVLLLHTGYGDARRLLDDLQGVDVAVIGHAPGYKFVPERHGDTLVIQGGTRGQYVSVLRLQLDGNGKITDYSGEEHPLGDTVAVSKDYDTVVNRFNKKYEALKAAAQPEDAENAGGGR